MRVLAISHSCASDVNQQLYVALARAGAQVELVIPATWSDAYASRRAPRLLPAVDFPVHHLPVWKAGHLMLHCYRAGMREVLDDARPDIVFIDEEPGSLVCAQIGALCTRRGVPFVAYTKQNICKHYPPPFGWIEKRIYQTARALVALTPEVREVLRAKGFRGPSPLLAHGCDLALFHPEPNPLLRAELGLKSPTVGYMGRMVPQKGLETLVASAAILRDKHLDFQVLMIGAGAQESDLRQRIEQLDLTRHFVWAGAVPHSRAGQYMRCIDVFALPSRTMPGWKEQFGRVLIEAMACGVPVAGAGSGAIPDLLRETGGGLVFQEGDAADCAQVLETLLFDRAARQLAAASGERAVRARFTYDAVANQLLEILEAAIAGRTGEAASLPAR